MNHTDQNTGQFFYNRSDYKEILGILTPIRTRTQTTLPKLHYLGLLTNALSILILTQKKMINRKSIFYLVLLAFSDFMYILLSELPNTLKSLELVDHDIFKTSDLTCFFYDYRTIVFHFYSVLLTLVVTVDRFNHIHNPLNFNRTLDNVKSKLIAGFFILIFCALIALPHGFLMVYNPNEKDCDASDFWKRKIGNTTLNNYQVYFTFTEPLVMWFTPGLIILCLNSFVIYKIFKSNQIKSKFGSKMMVSSYSIGPGTVNIRKQPWKSCVQRNSFDEDNENKFLNSPFTDSNNFIASNTNNTNKTKVITEYFKCSVKTNLSDDIEMNNIDIDRVNQTYADLNDSKMKKKRKFQREPSIDYTENTRIHSFKNPLFNYTQNSKQTVPFLKNSITSHNHKRPFSASVARKLYSEYGTRYKDNNNNYSYQTKRDSSVGAMSLDATGTRLTNYKINVNQISHYVTIIAVGFYFILSTIPYVMMVSFLNNQTLKLNYRLKEREDYLRDAEWIKFGTLKDMVGVAKLFYVSNHCFNFFYIYFLIVYFV